MVLPNDEDKKLAAEVAAWMTDLADQAANGTELNDYMHNLAVYGKTGRVNFKGMGVVASAVVAYRRDLAKRKERESMANSQHISALGEKFYAQVVLLSCVPVNSDFGTSWLHKFITPEGNVLSSFVQHEVRRLDTDGTEHDFKDGEVFWLSGKVKAHKEYKGVKETQLSHCGFAHSPEVVAALKTASKRKETPAGEYELDGLKYPVFDVVQADGKVVGFVVRLAPIGKKKQGNIIAKFECGHSFADEPRYGDHKGLDYYRDWAIRDGAKKAAAKTASDVHKE